MALRRCSRGGQGLALCGAEVECRHSYLEVAVLLCTGTESAQCSRLVEGGCQNMSSVQQLGLRTEWDAAAYVTPHPSFPSPHREFHGVKLQPRLVSPVSLQGVGPERCSGKALRPSLTAFRHGGNIGIRQTENKLERLLNFMEGFQIAGSVGGDNAPAQQAGIRRHRGPSLAGRAAAAATA